MKKEHYEHLLHKIFIGTQDGAKLFDLMQKWHSEIKVFPAEVDLSLFGGATGWANFVAGQGHFLVNIKDSITNHQNKMDAELKK